MMSTLYICYVCRSRKLRIRNTKQLLKSNQINIFLLFVDLFAPTSTFSIVPQKLISLSNSNGSPPSFYSCVQEASNEYSYILVTCMWIWRKWRLKKEILLPQKTSKNNLIQKFSCLVFIKHLKVPFLRVWRKNSKKMCILTFLLCDIYYECFRY